MKNFLSTIIIGSLALLGSFGFTQEVFAEYKYSIKCPTDQKYAVMVWTDYGDYETIGVPSFDPIKGNEFCAPLTSSIKDIVDLKQLGKTYYDNAKIVNTEKLECKSAIAGGSDDYDWDDISVFNGSYTDKITWKYSLPSTCKAGQRRIRYEVKGPGLSKQFFYYIGEYSQKTANQNKGSNPNAIKALCLGFKAKKDCNTKSNDQCLWNKWCKPKAIAEADHKKDIANIGKDTPWAKSIPNEKNIICSSVLEKIQSKCLGSPDLCRNECNQYSKCIYFSSKCEEKTNLTQEELRSISIEAADSYLKEKYPKPEGYLSKILPDCAFHGTCRSLDDLLVLGINIAKYLFGLIGTIAFAMFIYGGSRMMLSGGGSEGIQAGKDAMLHAVIGLIITFSSYLIVSFVLNMLKVGSDFRAIGLIMKYFV